jgi:DNA-binding beta-propeller fold protein YncE
MAVTTDSRRVYATTYAGVVVIDAQSRSILTTIVLSGGRIPYGGISMNPNGKQVYVSTNNTGAAMAVIDTTTNTEIGNLLGFGAGVAFSPDGSRAYVIGGFIGSGVYVFDTKTFALVGSIVLPSGGQLGIAVSPDGSRLYVSLPHSSFDLGGMTVIDTLHGVVLATLEVLPQTPPWGAVVVSDTGRFVYTLGSASRTISIIDSQSNEMVAAIVVGDRPTEMAIRQGGGDESQ